MPTRVLVVDDNQDAAELLELGLTNMGYVVRTASDENEFDRPDPSDPHIPT